MIGALDVLVVDDRPDTVRFLTEFLLQRCRRVDVATSVKEAEAAVARRRAAGERYHLIFCDFVMPGADGLVFLRQLRQHQDEVPFVFITGYRTLNATFEVEAQRLGVLAILDKPIELNEVQRLLDLATATYRRKREEQAKDQPFFGTSRVLRTNSQVLPREQTEAAAEAAPKGPLADASADSVRQGFHPDDYEPTAGALEPRPGTVAQQSAFDPNAALDPRKISPNDPRLSTPVEGYRRQPSNVIVMPGSTTRVRRSVDPAIVAPSGGTAGRGSEPILRRSGERGPGALVPPGGPGAAPNPSPAPPGPGTAAAPSSLPAATGGPVPGSAAFNAPRIPTPMPQTTLTTRVRRGVESPPRQDQTFAPSPGNELMQSRMVACAHCGKTFAVAVKQEAYTTVCIHCGHLQRVEPGS
ncbi:MAG: response regulator [Planctomycetota bacterium]|nr:response regulator [Planctomycetota bacterium]